MTGTSPLPFPAWHKLILGFLPSILWAGLIFGLSSISGLPGFEANVLDFIFKKSAHMVVYAVLFFLLWRGWLWVWPESKLTSAVWGPILLTLLYACTDEIHQTFVPGRFGTLRDVGYDLLGASIVWLYVYNYFPNWLCKIGKKISKKHP